MPEETGQAPAQPTEHEAAAALLDSWEKPEAPAAAAPDEPAAESEQPEVTEQLEPAEQPTEEPKSESRRFKLKYNGEEVEKEESDVISLAQQGFDYTQKTQALASERKALQEKVKAEVEQHARAYQEQLRITERVLFQTLMPELQGTDWNALAQNDPAQWAAKQQRLTDINGKLQATRQELARIDATVKQEAEVARNAEIQTAVEVLQRDIPGWSPEVYSKTLETAIELGMSDEKAKALTDASVVKALHYAAKYLELQKARPLVAKKVENAPKVIKPGSAEKPDPKTEQYRDAVSRVRKSEGRDPDALLSLARNFVS
jgi:hypothetical protein